MPARAAKKKRLPTPLVILDGDQSVFLESTAIYVSEHRNQTVLCGFLKYPCAGHACGCNSHLYTNKLQVSALLF